MFKKYKTLEDKLLIFCQENLQRITCKIVSKFFPANRLQEVRILSGGVFNKHIRKPLPCDSYSLVIILSIINCNRLEVKVQVAFLVLKIKFDGDLIGAVYDFLISECDSALPDEKGVWRSNFDFCHGSKSVINALRNRFINERADALAMLTGGVV